MKNKKGEMLAYQRRKVCVMKWRDKKVLLSIAHNIEMMELERRNKTKEVLKVVSDYNNSVGGMDRVDQHLASYPIIKK